MIAQRTMMKSSESAAVREAMRLLGQRSAGQRWVCEVCGMPHAGAAPDACESCGAHASLVPQPDVRLEIGSRW